MNGTSAELTRLPAPRRISKFEFVALMAGLMAVDALAVDIMLPAFPAIGASLGIVEPNNRSLILTVFLLGFGPLQLLFGPLADCVGRRRLIIGGLMLYVVTSVACAFAPGFGVMLAARFLQGAGAGAVRVAMSAAVRDRFVGQAMVDVMSLVAAIFLLVPIVGPTVGQLLLAAGSWKLIFVFIALVGTTFGVWATLRLDESLRPADRRSFRVGAIGEGFRLVLRQRHACLYGIVGAFMYGIISNLLNTAQPIYVDIFGLGPWFPVAFAFSTVVAALANLIMPRVTRRFGLRRTAHTAVVVIIGVSATSALQSLAGAPSVGSFFAMLLLLFPAVVATFTTTGALSMEPLGDVAGTAASVFGAVTMMGGALFGAVTAQLYDGTVTPVLWSNCILGVCALGSLAVAERGRFFTRDRELAGAVPNSAVEVPV